jgi:hypothetical protein
MELQEKPFIQAPHYYSTQNSYTDYELYKLKDWELDIIKIRCKCTCHNIFTDYVNRYALEHIDWNVWSECQSSIGWLGIMRLLAVECGVSHDKRRLGSLQYICSVTRLHNITYTYDLYVI